MFGETTISYIKIWNHPIETTIYKWLFGVPGRGYLENINRNPFSQQTLEAMGFGAQNSAIVRWALGVPWLFFH